MRPGERFVALAAAETADLWADVVQPRLDARRAALLSAAPCLHGCVTLPCRPCHKTLMSCSTLDDCLAVDVDEYGDMVCVGFVTLCWACRRANGSAFEAPHGRPDWALTAPSADHAAPDKLRSVSAAGAQPVQVAESTSPVPGRLPVNAHEALAGQAALGRGSAEGFAGNPGVLGSGLRLDADVQAVLRSLQPDAAAELELAAPGARTAESGSASLGETAESMGYGGRRLAAAAADEGPGSMAGLGSLDAARARAAAVAAWWREVSAGQATAPRQATEPDQAHAGPRAAAAGSGVIASEERRFREAAAAAGASLPGTFTGDFEEVRQPARACFLLCTCAPLFKCRMEGTDWHKACLLDYNLR